VPGDPKVEIDTLTSKGNRVIAETRGIGKLSNGNDYDNQYVWVFEFKDDAVFAIREYMDSHYIMSVVS
jgi:ketosteroid isomerase-like protein